MASYNKNPAALNEPDGIVAVWNLHMLERPEFVFHSQVRTLAPSYNVALTKPFDSVRRPLRILFSFPPKPRLRRLLLWSNPSVGHPIKTPASLEDAIISIWPYPPSVHHADGRDAECAQLDHGEHRRDGVQLARGHARSASGVTILRMWLKCSSDVERCILGNT